MKKHIPNFITCLNVLTGTLGIALIIDGGAEIAIYFVLIAAGFDFLDGLVARLLKVQSEMGKQLDSLADLVSFGLLPALALMELDSNFGMVGVALVSAMLIVPFSALRLAKFNIAMDQANEFKGLPTPANAIMITSFIYFYTDFWDILKLNDWLFLGPFLMQEGLVVFSLISCFLLVSNIPMIALKFKSMSWKGNELRYTLLILEVLGLAVFQLSFIPFVIPLYIMVSIVGNTLRKTFV